jgi:ribosomal protein S18 acetylase RimI-like enzyme
MLAQNGARQQVRMPGHNAAVLTLRDARPEDAAKVAEVHVRAWQVAYRGLLPDDDLDGLRAEDRAARYTFHLVGPEHPATTVALEDGEIRGFVTTGPARGCAQTVGEVYAINVDPAAWGRGVGRALMAHARARLAERGCTEALLWVLVGNVRAERFYRADGWRADGTQRDDEVWGVRVSELRYRRRLP